MMDKALLQEFNKFLGKAALNTYVAGGQGVDPEEAGFKELEYKEGVWRYKDSYTGFFQSWGREVVWYNEKPVWNQIYGGGMTKNFQDNAKFAHETFDFLKKALSAGEKREEFQPRGPSRFTEGDWEYFCMQLGDIANFRGNERIEFRYKQVFTYDFLGGLIIAR